MCLIKFDTSKISQHNIDLISDYQYNFSMATEKADGQREHTIKIYLNTVRLFAEWLQDDLEKATASQINKYVESFKSHNTKNLKILTLKKFYEYLIGEIPSLSDNPVRKPTQKDRDKNVTRDKYLDKKQLKALLNEVEKEIGKYKKEGKLPYMYAAMKDYAMFQTLFRTGMRVGNVCGIKLNGIDWDERKISISRDDFKTDKNFEIIIGEELVSELQKYLAIRDNLKPKSDYLFVSIRGQKMNGDAVYKALNKYAERTDCIEKIHPHMMRHTCATIMLENGARLEDVKNVLGHSSIQTTEIYGHTTEDSMRGAATILDRVRI